MRIQIIAFILLIYSLKLNAQPNLISNGEFETFSVCPGNSGGDIGYASPWYDPTGATSDYYNACNSNGFNVPNSGGGFQYALSGVAYAGFFTFGINNQREYIQAQLTDSLVAGIRYRVSFYVNLHDNFQYATNNIGAYLSTTAVNSTGPGSVLSYPAQVVNAASNPLTSQTNWMLISDTMTALGGEKFITIGNFSTDSNTDTVYVGGPIQGVISYYYIDDVSVYPDSLTGILQSNSEETSVSVFPNPASDVLNFQTSPAHDPSFFHIYNIIGEELKSFSFSAGQTHFALSVAELPNGIYTWREMQDGLVIDAGKIVISR